MPGRTSVIGVRALGWLGALSLAAVTVRVALMAGAPIASDDLWWHLSLGQAYMAQGPNLAADPLLFSAQAPPPPHSWLFDLLLGLTATLGGLPGLRLLHAGAAVAIIGFAYAILRREARSTPLALAATALLAVLMADRIERLRPDLVSIPAAYLLYRLLLDPRGRSAGPSWAAIAGAITVMTLWANAHALFAVGPLLVGAGLFGAGLAWLGERRAPEPDGGDSSAGTQAAATDIRALRRIGLALALGLIGGLLNPRGLAQHLSYLESRSGSALALIGDDWTPFHALHFSTEQVALQLSGWIAADALFLSFIATSAGALLCWARHPRRGSVRSLHLPLLALGVASLVAISVSDRFLWMSLFPMLFLLRQSRRLDHSMWSLGLTTVCVLLVAVLAHSFVDRWGRLPRDRAGLETYLARDYSLKYPIDDVRFIRQSGLEGRLFSRYALGGFVGYWLAPDVQPLANGTMNFAPGVFEDYLAIADLRGVEPGERMVDVLDRRKIDLHLGTGLPARFSRELMKFHTTTDLQDDPDSLVVYRTPLSAVTLRRGERFADNLERVEGWYREQGIPFDPTRGFDIVGLLRDHLDWAVRQRIVPQNYGALRALVADGSLAEPERSDGPEEAAARETLALLHLLLGDYPGQLAFDTALLAQRPRHAASLRRRVYANLRLRHFDAARSDHDLLAQVDPGSPVTLAFDRAIRAFEQYAVAAASLPAGAPAAAARLDHARALLRGLPVVGMRAYNQRIRSQLAWPLPIPRPRAARFDRVRPLAGIE